VHNHAGHNHADTDRVTQFYADAWIGGDTHAVRRMIAADAEIEWNLDAPVDDEEIVQTMNRIAAFADSVTVISRTCTEDRAAVIYDCAAPFGTARIAEFLTVAQGRITEIRQVHDPVAIRRYFPGLLEE
jgi:ketosteroid isomerase-like protein